MNRALQELLDRLEATQKPGGKGWKARCPLHDDDHPSLEIDLADDDGKPLIICRVCGAIGNEIVSWAGTTWAEVLAEDCPPKPLPKSRIVAKYDYLDEAGVLRYQTCRVEPGRNGRRKDFFQRRPAGGNEWVNNLEGVERLLYRLPELVTAAPAEPVWIPEGEGKVEALRQLDLVATCNVGGGGKGKWLPVYTNVLRGRKVVILPDNDDPGREHAREVAKALEGMAASVKVLELPGLPAKGDVIDWLAAGGTLEQLLQLEAAVKSGEFPEPIPASLLKGSGPSGDWLWHGIIARGSITLFSALWKSGKTTLMAHLLKSCELGGPFCGLEVTPCRVLYVTEESEPRWADRRDRLGLADHVHFEIRPFAARPKLDGWLRFLDFTARKIKQNRYDLVVLDTMANLWPVKDENDASQVQAALMPIHQCLGRAAGLLVHHNRKGDGTEATASRGSGALTGWVDTIIELRRYLPTNRKDRRRVLTGYSREAEIPEELVIELTAAGYITHGDRADAWKGDLKTALLRMLPCDGNGWTFEQIKENWREDEVPTKQRVVDALDLLGEEGHVLKTGEGVKGDPFRYRATPPA